MKEELALAQSVISFDSLSDLLAELDHCVETYSKMTKRYEDRLGSLLRQAKDSSDPKLRTVSAESALIGQSDPDQQNKKKREDKKREVEDKGWVVLEAGDVTIRLANGSESQLISNEISLLFKVIEALKSKIATIEASRKLISELTAQGFKSDRRLKVVFKDGLPRYLIPSTEAPIQQRKFRYGEQFRLAVLK
ncbi:MAG: hypothetical protein JRN15_05990 [Nitrososphaerota archaeon]|jgi:hypothetical protein|nr:hypothetical protein [Nitrososphaerota archaeon]